MKIKISHLIDEKFPPTGRAKKRGANIRQFAKAINTDETSAAKIYDGTIASIRFETLENICKVLGCTPLDIFVSADQETQRQITYLISISENSKEKDGTE